MVHATTCQQARAISRSVRRSISAPGRCTRILLRRAAAFTTYLALILAPWQASSQEPASFASEPHVFEAFSGDAVDAELGRFRVPLNRAAGSADSLELVFVRFPATTPHPGPPIVYLAGGPGGSGIATARGSRFPLFMALRKHGDVIAFDQRGTGMSDGPAPASCPFGRSLPASEPVTEESLRELTIEVARECGEYWREEGVDLAAYNTRESADDLADLAEALGTSRLNLWAISYGTHLALAAIRRHPDLVERAILAGVEGPDHTIKLPSIASGQLDQLERLIAADPESRVRFTDLRGLIRGVLEDLDRQPATVENISADLADTTRSSVSRFAVEMRTINALRDPGTMVTVPYLFERMAEGDFSQLGGVGGVGGFSAMPEATDAASGISPERRARYVHEDSTTVLGGGDQLINAYMAEALGVPDLGATFRAPVRSDIPALFISGTLDGRTPPANAEEVLRGFPRGRHLVIDNAGHSDDLFLSSPRILNVMHAFMADDPLPTLRLTVEPPNLSDGALPPTLSEEFMESIVGAYARGPADVWRVVRGGTVRSLDERGREIGRTTQLLVRIRGNGYPFAANADSTFSIPFFGPNLRFRFVRDGSGRVTRLDFTGSTGEQSTLDPVSWEDVAFLSGESWLVAGPFQSQGDNFCDRTFLSETTSPARADGPATAPDGPPWTPGTGDDGFVDFEESFGGSLAGAVGYARATIMADASGAVQLRIGTDDDARVYLRGQLVHRYDGQRSAWEEQDLVPIRLEAGENPLLVKVCNRDSDWRFNLRITDSDGRSLVRDVELGIFRVSTGAGGGR